MNVYIIYNNGMGYLYKQFKLLEMRKSSSKSELRDRPEKKTTGEQADNDEQVGSESEEEEEESGSEEEEEEESGSGEEEEEEEEASSSGEEVEVRLSPLVVVYHYCLCKSRR